MIVRKLCSRQLFCITAAFELGGDTAVDLARRLSAKLALGDRYIV